MTLATLGLLFRDHWPKIVAAILVPIILGAIGLWIAKQERETIREENVLVETGRKEVKLEQTERTIRDVEAYRKAAERPDAGELGRVRAESDRCTRNPAACE